MAARVVLDTETLNEAHLAIGACVTTGVTSMPQPKIHTAPPGRALVVVVGDLHCGSTLGLVDKRGCRRDGGGHVDPSPGQLWLWEKWLEFVREVARLGRGRRRYVIVNGDAIDGDHHQTIQQMSGNLATQRGIAKRALKPLLQWADRLFWVRGTGAHVGAESQDDDQLAQDLGAVETPTGDASWWELRAELGGVLFDVSHHVGGGGRLWTAGGVAVRLASEAILQAVAEGERVPDLVIRSHIHKCHDSATNVEGCRAITCPAWQLRTEYGYRIAAKPADIGGILVQCAEGVIEHVEVKRYKAPRAAIWRDVHGV